MEKILTMEINIGDKTPLVKVRLTTGELKYLEDNAVCDECNHSIAFHDYHKLKEVMQCQVCNCELPEEE